MRRLLAWITVAGLAAAPLAAAAGPGLTKDETKPAATAIQSRPRLGVLVMELTEELRQHYGAAADRGVLVGRVEPGSAAATAGVRVGDVIVEVDRRAVTGSEDVVNALASHRKGDVVDVVVVRQGTTHTLAATLQDATLTANDVLRALRAWPFGEWLRRSPADQRCDA